MKHKALSTLVGRAFLLSLLYKLMIMFVQSNEKLIKDFLDQLKDEVENPEEYDKPGDLPSYYLWEEIERRGLEKQVPEFEIKSFLIIK